MELTVRNAKFFCKHYKDIKDSRGQIQKQSFRIFPLKVRDEVFGTFAFIKDNTEVRANETNFLNNYRMTILGNLAGGVAHELNTPLGLTRLAAEMLLNSFESGEFDQDSSTMYLNQIIKSVDKMSSIVKQVLRFSHREDIDVKTQLNLNELIRESIIMYGKLLRTDDITLEMKLAESLPDVFAVPSLMQTVITDLINNARDSLANVVVEQGRKITITTQYRPELDCISFCVIDNGREMDISLREKLFDSFFDPSTQESEQKNGLGLGLSVSYGIIKRHGGLMTVDTAEHGGTQFSILLPVKDEEVKT